MTLTTLRRRTKLRPANVPISERCEVCATRAIGDFRKPGEKLTEGQFCAEHYGRVEYTDEPCDQCGGTLRWIDTLICARPACEGTCRGERDEPDEDGAIVDCATCDGAGAECRDCGGCGFRRVVDRSRQEEEWDARAESSATQRSEEL